MSDNFDLTYKLLFRKYYANLLFYATRIVGDEEAGLLILLPGLQQLGLELGAGLGVQGAEGLVHEQHLGIRRIGPGDGYPLLHAAGKLLGIVVRKLGQVHLFQVLHGQLVGLLAFDALHLQGKAHVFLNGQPGE